MRVDLTFSEVILFNIKRHTLDLLDSQIHSIDSIVFYVIEKKNNRDTDTESVERRANRMSSFDRYAS